MLFHRKTTVCLKYFGQDCSVNHFDLIANLFLELRKKYNLTTSASCLISEKLGHIVEQDRNMFVNKILSVLLKDENFVQFKR